MENRVIITGATGFVGSNLARKFVQKGFEVYLIVREGSSYHNIQDIVSDVIIYTYTGDVKGIYQFLLNSKSDTIYHIASCFVAEHKSEDIDRLVDSNLLFGLKVAEAAQLAQHEKEAEAPVQDPEQPQIETAKSSPPSSKTATNFQPEQSQQHSSKP